MVDQSITMDATTAISAPSRTTQVSPHIKLVLAQNTTTNSISISSEAAANLQYASYIDLDPNNYFTVADIADSSRVDFGAYPASPTGYYTQITFNYSGYYQISARATVFADNPVLQNALDFYHFHLILNAPDFSGGTPSYSLSHYSFDEFGDGTYPTGQSTLNVMGVYAVNAGSTMTVSAVTARSMIMLGGVFAYKSTYVTATYMGIKDDINLGYDSFYQMKNLAAST